MPRRMRLACGRVLLAGLVALAAMPAAVPGAVAAPSFAGKTVHVIVNYAAGGPVDGFIRTFTRFLEAHIPGHPAVVVENMPGAGGMLAANHMVKAAKPDGLTIGFLSGIVNDVLVGGAGVRFDMGSMRWLGAIPTTHVTLAATSLGLGTPRDLAASDRLVLAGYGGWMDVATRLFLDLAGAKYRYVTGYPGQAATIMALRQGEATLADAGVNIYLPNRAAWQQEGRFAPLVQRGELGADGVLRRSALLPDLPTIGEAIAAIDARAGETAEFRAYRRIVGANAVQYLLVLPPAAAPATVQALADAVRASFRDPQAIAAARERLKVAYSFLDAAETGATIERLRRDFAADAEAAEIMRRMIRQ